MSAVVAYYIVHEGAHLICACIMGVFKQINFMGLGMQIDEYSTAMTDAQMGIFCLVGALATFSVGYELRGEQYYPMLEIAPQNDKPIGKYGQMRLDFLKKHRRGTYTTLLTGCRLTKHLSATDQEVRSQVEIMTAELAKQRGIDENLKATNPRLWVQEMNNCKASAEEVVLREVVYR